MQKYAKYVVSAFLCLFILGSSNPGRVNENGFFMQDTARYLKNPNYLHEIELYKSYKMKQADVVMMGNSITHGANWNQLLDRDNVIEQGIPSDITEGYLNRMEYVYNMRPKVVFIMGGINDIYNWIPVEEILRNYKMILSGLRVRGITPIIQSTLYAGKTWPSSADRNKVVDKLNDQLRGYAIKNNIEFIDLNKSMSSGNYLKPQLTHDGLHLNARGFRIWASEVDKVLAKKGL